MRYLSYSRFAPVNRLNTRALVAAYTVADKTEKAFFWQMVAACAIIVLVVMVA